MATFRKRAAGWQAEVRRRRPRPFYQSATFPTKAQAVAWANRIETELHTIRAGMLPDKTLADACDKYADEVSPGKRGARWERARLAALGGSAMGRKALADLGAGDWKGWRESRLLAASAGTVLREWNLFSHLYTVAIKEWGWARVNPLTQIQRPTEPPHRERLPTPDELDRLAQAFGGDLTTATGRVWAAFRLSCLTAMRSGEILGLEWSDIDGPVANLAMTKNGSPRRVPLSADALAILESLPRTGASVFNLSRAARDALWRKVCRRALVDDLHFHDARAYAVTMMARKVDILTLARITGHKDLKMLQVYYRESAEDIAGKL